MYEESYRKYYANGTGSLLSTSMKLKIKSRRSAEEKPLSVNSMLPQGLWTKYFLAKQGFDIGPIRLF
jgi:hypothetical protein